MKRKLLEYLKKIDSKEEEFIKNEKNVLAPYVIKKGSSVIDTDKMIREGAMIDIMKQPRFVDIPEHTHKYMEIIYMFSGSATHIIDKKLSWKQMMFCLSNREHRIQQAPRGITILELKYLFFRSFYNIRSAC